MCPATLGDGPHNCRLSRKRPTITRCKGAPPAEIRGACAHLNSGHHGVGGGGDARHALQEIKRHTLCHQDAGRCAMHAAEDRPLHHKVPVLVRPRQLQSRVHRCADLHPGEGKAYFRKGLRFKVFKVSYFTCMYSSMTTKETSMEQGTSSMRSEGISYSSHYPGPSVSAQSEVKQSSHCGCCTLSATARPASTPSALARKLATAFVSAGILQTCSQQLRTHHVLQAWASRCTRPGTHVESVVTSPMPAESSSNASLTICKSI